MDFLRRAVTDEPTIGLLLKQVFQLPDELGSRRRDALVYEVQCLAMVPVNPLAEVIDLGIVHEPTPDEAEVMVKEHENVAANGPGVRPSAAVEHAVNLCIAIGHPFIA